MSSALGSSGETRSAAPNCGGTAAHTVNKVPIGSTLFIVPDKKAVF
jgi:hypothetical protein